MNSTFIVASVQLPPVFLNKRETTARACEAIAEAAKQGARLAVFPEVYISAYPDWVWVVPNSNGPVLNELYHELLAQSVRIPDETTEALCRAARLAKIHVAIGMNERNTEASSGSLYNTLLFIDDKGNILGKRRKLMPTGGERTVWAQGDGSTLDTFDLGLVKVAGLICWENYMPLARQAMYARGTEILVTPTWDKSENWQTSLRHIAREGGMFVISSCAAIKMDDIPDRYEFKSFYPADREWINTGNSCIIDPGGKYLAGPLEKSQQILYAEIDLSQISAAKRMFDVAGHYARPDVFQLRINRKANIQIEEE
ncbi:MAG: carbon-nitrogen hydrolase family protein [Calditrichales bacterium]|nr:MAG: carbon-nitrogen hydrolase family protein [Calditrichales bacterium]